MQKHRVAPAVDESLKSSDFYVQEARRLKHLADASMPDKFSKSLMYVESVLSFIQYGTAMEYEHKDPNKIFKVYFDTLNFCRYYICNSKSSTLSNCEKKLSVLSLRLQAFLCLKMFKTKKTEAAKLKRVLDDHNKATTSKQAPSPFQPNGQWSRSNGTPSPMSPQPSPAGSTASMGSSSSASSTASAQRIQSVTAQYLQHVRYLSDCHEIWEQTDAAMLDHKDFFRNLDNDCGRLTMQSSVPEIVRYIKVGLHRLKEVS
ncbi:hypothetical protein CAPTEDRAFT_127205 [Capitella teleta]|uniref:AF4/FMR2 family member lilli n=1 Tax=Capitella teleta TaxID=283909 RepID=R7URU4_CAPTE|nr:hypothetical protein CAPTEDRAFT_127205 [Capitella teleta]|eukprot:ELU08925.1 hypothetical protein CAPTEDRAFT_127205 [Capitella teleta]